MGTVDIFLPLVLFSVFAFTNNARAATYNRTNFKIQNKCNYTVWAAAIPGGGEKLDPGQSWSIDVPAGTAQSRIWGRTNCSFDSFGRGRCETGDCVGNLVCTSFGDPPVTLAEYSLTQFNDLDFFDISLVLGFNIPMEFVGQSAVSQKVKNCIDSCQYQVYADLGLGQLTLIDLRPSTSGCKGVICSADINGQCPDELQAPGGCNNPCTVFKTTEYCCDSLTTCGPTNYSRFFKERCPNVYSYPMDDATNTFTCPSGTNYSVVFCP